MLTSHCQRDSDQHRPQQVSGHTLVFSCVLLLGAADSERAIGQAGKTVEALQGAPLPGPFYGRGGLPLSLAVEHNGGPGVHHRVRWLHGDRGCA